MSVFRSQTNATVEITQAVDPAFFRQGDVDREIQRLSRDFGQQARVIPADLPSGGRAVIAAWGAVALTPLDSATMDALRGGTPVHSGLLVGALGELRASARLGLPVYGLGGGPGFIWSANHNSSGRACCASPPSIPALSSIPRRNPPHQRHRPTRLAFPLRRTGPAARPDPTDRGLTARQSATGQPARSDTARSISWLCKHARIKQRIRRSDRGSECRAAVIRASGVARFSLVAGRPPCRVDRRQWGL
jgi:hypothetical protein